MVKDKVVIVTGGGKGLGRYIAGTFVEAEAKVVIAEIDAAALETAVEELKTRSEAVLGVQTDVRDEEQVSRLVAQVIERFGRVDVLVNNAAIVTHSHVWPSTAWTKPWPLIRDMPLEFWHKVIETNITGTYLCSKHVIPHMENQGSGHIITFPGGGSAQKLGVLAYSLTKQAVTVFARFLAEEVRASNICVLAVSPGATIATEDAPEEVKASYPGPEVIGNRYVLAADAPMALSGHSVRLVDGRLEAIPER
jgi:NAD(P)-dependent dehydrogenase (short-subunit alcohol dehydrogenase family)